MELIIFIGGIAIFLFLINLSGRVKQLEKLAGLPATETELQHRNPVPPPIPFQPPPVGPTSYEQLIQWLKEDWLLKLGALLLLIGFGWLTTYAFLNNWIGPMGRISLGITAGIFFILLGWWRIKNYVHQGGIFLVLGSTTVLLTIFAARAVYGFFTPAAALGVMFLSTAFVAIASVRYKSRALALSSLILAGVAPLLTDTPAPDYIGLFSYLLAVILGALWIVALTGRRELTAAALVLVTLYSLPHLFSLTLADRGALLLFAYAFTAAFFLTNSAGIVRLNRKEIVPDLLTAAGNGLFLLGWIAVAAPSEWKSSIMAAWTVVFTAGAFLIFRVTNRREPFYVYAGVGIALLAAATAAELEGAALTIAYTIESGAIALIAYLVTNDIKIGQRMSLLLAGPALLSLESIFARVWTSEVIHEDFFVLLILGVTTFGLGMLFLHPSRETADREPRQLNGALLVGGSAYFYVLLWRSLHAGLINDNTAVLIALVTYTVIGLAAYFSRITVEQRGLRLYGGALIGFVVGRLLLVDVWNMELAGRVATFFVIGALLVSTAFIGRKKQ